MSQGDDSHGPPSADDETMLAKGVGPEADLGPKFDVLGTIGRGGMGSVLMVRHRAMDRVRAVKLLHLEGAANDPELIERFRREATIASDLYHPNIVQIYDFDFAPNGQPYITMEYLEGEDLHSLLRRQGPLDLERAIQLLTGVADALDRVHELGVVHRDLKPANFFVTADGTVKILDFGISHVEWEGPSLTQTGEILGTPAYMSPEQLRGSKVDSRADIYSLGAVAYELLTGQRPFEATSPAMLVAHILEEPPRLETLERSQLPEHVVSALGRAMAKNPDQRFASAYEFIQALAGPGLRTEVERLSAAVIVGPPPETGRTTMPVVKRSRWPVIALVALALVAAAVAGWLFLFGDTGEPVAGAGGAVGWPLLVAPARVDLADVDDPWIAGAVARLVERHFALDPRVRVVPGGEATVRLGERYRPLGGNPGPQELGEIKRLSGAASVLWLELDPGGRGIVATATLVDATSGEQVWSHRADGSGYEAAIEAVTWEFGNRLLRDVPRPAVTPRERERCGLAGEECRLALMAEEAILNLGLFERAGRLARELPAPLGGFWGALAAIPEKSLSGQHREVISDAALSADPPAELGADRAALWRAFADPAWAGQGQAPPICELTDSRDPLVRHIARRINEDASCEDLDAPYCTTVDTFLDRLTCLGDSAMRDDAEVALRYYEEFAETDIASKLHVATFSMLPMEQDLDLARTWLARAGLRHQGDDAAIANSMARLELAQRNPTEALVWARRSVNPIWREGASYLLSGRFQDGVDRVCHAAVQMVGTQADPPAYMLDVIVRPALQPVLLLASRELSGKWTGVIRENASVPALLGSTVELAEAVGEGDRSVCRRLDQVPEALRLEFLYHCGRWQELVKVARLRGEQGYAERASRFLVAEANLRLERFEQAEEGFASVERDPVIRSTNPVSSLLALERLGRLAERRGDRDAARRHYAEMIRLWRVTDLELADVERAREAIGRLGG
jgi:hypothetical protein